MQASLIAQPQEVKPARKLMDRVRDRMRIKRSSKSTEQIYCHWILQYILFNGKRHPAEKGGGGKSRRYIPVFLMTRNGILRLILVAAVLICQSCATSRLWEDTDTNARVWISADRIAEQNLKSRGVQYQPYAIKQGKGYLVNKTRWGKMKDYQLRMLGTPVILVVDAATTVVVVGFYASITDTEGTICLIEALSH